MDIQVKPDASGTNFTEWCNYFGNQQLRLTIASSGLVKELLIDPIPESCYPVMKIKKKQNANNAQKQNFEIWSANKF